MDVLRASSLAEALERAEQGRADHPYAPFNLLVASPEMGAVHYHPSVEDATKIDALTPGWHVLPNGRMDDPADPKVVRAKGLLDALDDDLDEPALVREMGTILADHEAAADTPDAPAWFPEALRGRLSALCVHLPAYGTRSSSVLMMNEGGEGAYYHAEGAPCRVPLRRVYTGRMGR